MLRFSATTYLKWEYQPLKRDSSWIRTIKEQRRQINKLIKENPSLKPFLDEAKEDSYLGGLDLAVEEIKMGIKTFPSQVPYSGELISNGDFFPGELTDADRELLTLYGISPISITQIHEE